MESTLSFEEAKSKKILFFDGVCSICNRSVDYIIKHNPKGNIYFASLQSDFAAEFLLSHGRDPKQLHTLLYYSDRKVYDRSTALIELNKELTGFRSFLIKVWSIKPQFARDMLYNFIAKNRYRILTPKQQCRIPTPEESARFLD